MGEMSRALVFDYDGVLADTEPLHWKSWEALLLPYGFQFTWEEYCRFGQGVSDDLMFASILNRVPGLSVGELSRLNLLRKREVLEWSLTKCPIPPETIRMLTTLKAYRIGLVTSSERTEVEPILRASAIYEKFDALVFGCDVAAHKPAPDPYLMIAKNLGVDTGIAFEDSESGLESAQAAGFNAVRIDHPGELAQVVARFLRD
jgi:beta-phosphoglucomutase